MSLSALINVDRVSMIVAFAPESPRHTSTAAVAFIDLEDAPAIDHVVAYRPENPNPVLPVFLAVATAERPEN